MTRRIRVPRKKQKTIDPKGLKINELLKTIEDLKVEILSLKAIPARHNPSVDPFTTDTVHRLSDDITQRFAVEEREEWRHWMGEIPAIHFPTHWAVTVIPPFAGAIARFKVYELDPDKNVSIYLDVSDSLGYFGSPYWEVYPVNGDVDRIAMGEVTHLIHVIEAALSEQRSNV